MSNIDFIMTKSLLVMGNLFKKYCIISDQKKYGVGIGTREARR